MIVDARTVEGPMLTVEGAEPAPPALCDPIRIWRDMAMPADCPVVEDGDIFAALAWARKVTWGRRGMKAWPACVLWSPLYPLLAWTSRCIEAGR